ncbi:hypothetical protein PUN28_007437 [Cardiocondyla obscurior]|uniref:Uncharacterized protein n=1 Tax=Cardiocondyla obscurior TaxID=286306 RepID=A0AAW2G578_9HYME
MNAENARIIKENRKMKSSALLALQDCSVRIGRTRTSRNVCRNHHFSNKKNTKLFFFSATHRFFVPCYIYLYFVRIKIFSIFRHFLLGRYSSARICIYFSVSMN